MSKSNSFCFDYSLTGCMRLNSIECHSSDMFKLPTCRDIVLLYSLFLFLSFPEPLELSRVMTSPEVIQRYEELLRKSGGDNQRDRTGPDCASSSRLPSHSDVHVSCISQQRVQVCSRTNIHIE